MSSTPITIAFAGSGESSLENITELMDDLLHDPDQDIRLIFPASKEHSNPNLNKVVEWADTAGFDFSVVSSPEARDGKVRAAKKSIELSIDGLESDEVNTDLVYSLLEDKKEDREAVLILLYGEDAPGEVIEDLLEAALDAGIKVQDLTAGLDDIKFADDEPEPAAEPEPEETPAPRGRRKTTAVLEPEVEVPLEDTETPQEMAARVKEEIAAKKMAALANADANLESKRSAKVEDLPHDVQKASVLSNSVVQSEDLSALEDVIGWAAAFMLATDESNAAVNLSAEVKPRPLTQALIEAKKWLQERHSTPSEVTESTESDETPSVVPEDQGGAPKRSRGRPRADGTPAQPRDPNEPTVTVFEDEEGNLTKAGRGRPPKGQKRIKITAQEAEDLGLNEE